MTWLAAAMSVAALAACASVPLRDEGTVVRVEDRVLHRIDARLFGHFLERPSWGETGVEAALAPGTARLEPGVLARLRDLRAPLLRFPGGTDVDYLDWRDMVDRVPGRGGPRPVSIGHLGHAVTNRFGYDEFLRLCEALGAEALLVVNLGDALLGRRPLAEAAMQAAALVAYVNAPLGAKLPAGMTDWPQVRAANGRHRPYAVRYVQIGNEAQVMLAQLRERQFEDPVGRYLEALEAYVAAIRAVDPALEIIVDAVSDRVVELIHARLGAQVRFLSQHHYLPWRMNGAERDGRKLGAHELSAEEVWYAWVAIPGTPNERGESVIDGPALRGSRRWGYQAAVTEWNWNGFWELPAGAPPFDSGFAKALGAAGFLHAFMRAGDALAIACQSTAVGERWSIASIRVDPAGRVPAHFLPTGMLAAFIGRRHGEVLLATSTRNVPSYSQPLRLGSIPPQPRVALLDALATRSGRALYVHAINRHYRDALGVTFDLSAFAGRTGRAVLHAFEGRLADEPHAGEPREAAWTSEREATVEDGSVRVQLPPRSVSVLEVELLR